MLEEKGAETMLEYFYKERRTMVDFRQGPLGSHFDGFAAYLKNSGYSHSRAKDILGKCCLFNTFLIDEGLTDCKSVSPSLIEPFLAVYLADFRSTTPYCARTNTRCALRHLFDYLIGRGVIEPIVPKPIVTQYSWVLEPYLEYLRKECLRAEATIQRICQQLCLFLEGLGNKVTPKRLKSVKAESIEAYVKQHLGKSPHNLRQLASTLRGFLRFCAHQGYTTTDLSGMIPQVPSYRLATLPRGLEESDLQHILKHIDQNTAVGCRDYAIMLLLMAYGIRGKQAAELLLEDICWPRSTIRIRAQKGGKEVVLPLLESVGEAILRYLRNRPEGPFREVFLAMRAPFHPLSGLAVSVRARFYIRKAGVKVPRAGSASFRHSWAIRALAHDTPMKAIADVLGHRCLDTTFIYAKADLKTLQQVAMAWPEVKP